MKKFIMMMVVFVMSAAIVGATTKSKKDKKKKKPRKELVVLNNRSDSISYTAGMFVTNGLMDYLSTRAKVDTTLKAELMEGINKALSADKDELKRIKAYMAGINVVEMLQENIIPGIKNDFKDTRDSINSDMVVAGFVAAIEGNSNVCNKEDAMNYFKKNRETDVNEKLERQYKKTIEMGETFLRENAKNPEVVTLPDGLQYKILEKGTGAIPTKDDVVIVKYEGRLVDGKVFDSSYKRKEQTNKFRPTDVIKGWTEVLTMMPVGSKWEVYIPYNLAYGNRKAGMIDPYSTLIFIVELVGIDK